MSGSGVPAPIDDDRQAERMRRRTTLVSGIGGYIDAGSIVAGSVGLTYWTAKFGLTHSAVGLLGAISSNAISAGIGALVGGYLCDRFGRKRVFTKNLLFYMFGVLWLIFVSSGWMLFVGYVLVGLAVGSDVPASWTMMSEAARSERRGATGAIMQLLWNTGPVVVLLLGLALQPLGLLGVRLIFVHLFLLALVTYFGRRSITESSRWKQAQAGDEPEAAKPRASLIAPFREVLSGRGKRAVAFCLGLYLFWNLMAGTNGFYQPYLLKTFGHQSNALSVGLQALYFSLTI
ncbi:MAG: MFS transporter, partial [Alphaproteobacteria bacterium]|nr:MFS transporter [Alphaproteobacteria bacterium]